MMEKDNKEELNINKLINFLHKYNYDYKTINIDIINKGDNYVTLEINVIDNNKNNIGKKKYKKYTKKYNRKNPISEKSLSNLKNNKIYNNDLEKKSIYKINENNNKNEIDVKELEICSLDIIEKDKSSYFNYNSLIFKDNKEITDLKSFYENNNIIKSNILCLQEKIVNNHKIDIYNLNKIIKNINDFINLEECNIINGVIWKPKDVICLLQNLLNRINTILTNYKILLLNKKNRDKDYLFIIK